MRAVVNGKDLTSLPLLTTYRPNFCCECGEKIVRLRWRVWTSRKFCDTCFRMVGRDYWLRRAIATTMLLLTGILIGRGVRHEAPPLIIERPVQLSTQPPSAAESTTTP